MIAAPAANADPKKTAARTMMPRIDPVTISSCSFADGFSIADCQNPPSVVSTVAFTLCGYNSPFPQPDALERATLSGVPAR